MVKVSKHKQPASVEEVKRRDRRVRATDNGQYADRSVKKKKKKEKVNYCVLFENRASRDKKGRPRYIIATTILLILYHRVQFDYIILLYCDRHEWYQY